MCDNAEHVYKYVSVVIPGRSVPQRLLIAHRDEVAGA